MKLKILIIAMDALDEVMVRKFNCRNLMQAECGSTDISEFQLPKTVVLWSSFLTGKNMEGEIKEDLWDFTLPKERTFFKSFASFSAIDVPAFTLKQKEHAEERKCLAAYFKKENSIEGFDKTVWKNHESNKKEFFSLIGKADCEAMMAYFDLADAIGHLSFGIDEKMRQAYGELDKIAAEASKICDCPILVVSDHGMERIGEGRYGDHTNRGFWSSNAKLGLKLKNPKITDFYKLIANIGGKNG